MKNFSIKMNNFEGPFDLLLELIQNNKFSINDVSLSKITSDYISYVNNNELSLKDVSFFVYIAATLMLLKSKTLLPKLILNEKEEEDIGILKNKLKFLKEIKDVSLKIKKNFKKKILYKKIYKKQIEIKFRPVQSINLTNILISLDRLIISSPLIVKLPNVEVQKQKTLKEVIFEVKEKINRFLKLNFSELVDFHKKKKTVTFLAILELFKDGQIYLKQNESSGEIVIEKKK